MREERLRVLVAHPERQHSHQLAAALDAAGLLGRYFHSAALPASVAAEIPESRRRRVRWFQPMRRMLPYVLPPGPSAHVFHAMLEHYDQALARRLPNEGCLAVVAYERTALRTFEAAKRLGMACILDAASVHHTMQSFWTPAVNTEKMALRKDREIALADQVLTCSSLARDSYVAAGVPAEKVRIVSLGVEATAFRRLAPADGAREHGPLRFCFAGRVNLLKGGDLLLAACRKLRASGLDFTLAIAGGKVGSDPALIRRFAEFAELRGRIPHAELPGFYSEADVFVTPSRFDSFGLVVAEALACGLPAIVTENVGAKDMIRDGVNGWIIPAGDADALAERMAWCAANPQAVRAMSGTARVSAEARDWGTYRGEAVATIRAFFDDWVRRNGQGSKTMNLDLAGRPTADRR